MADEIEEFLRRAAMRRAAQQQAAQQAAQRQAPVQQAMPAPPPPPARPALAPAFPQSEAVEVEIVYDEPALGAGVSSHVAQALDNRQFTERARHLGEEVGQADDKMGARLHRKFDHQVGQLRSTTASSVPAASTAQQSFDEARQGAAGAAPAGAGDAAAQAAGVSASEIAQLLRTPRNIRHAIILNEILARPEDRW